MGPAAGMYVIYDKVNQVPMLLDEATYRKVEPIVTSGRPNLEGIDYQASRQKMRSQTVDKTKLIVSEEKKDDLIAIYDKVNAAVMAVPRWAYEKVKHHYADSVANHSVKLASAQTPSSTSKTAFKVVAKPVEKQLTEEELMAQLTKAHPILAYRPPSPVLPPSPPGVVCGLGLVSCSVHSVSRAPVASASLIVPEPAKVVAPEDAPFAALRPPSAALRPPSAALRPPSAAASALSGGRDSERRTSTQRKSVCFAEPVETHVQIKATVVEEGPQIFDKVNKCFMKVPREIYLRVKHFYEHDLTYLYDRVNDCPMQVPWSTYMKVRRLYPAGFVPEVAAMPADETLFVNIEDRVNGGKMRIPWHIFLQVRHYYVSTPAPSGSAPQDAETEAETESIEGPEIFDKVNNCFMKVPRPIYLKVKHFYNDDETYLYDRVNDCPMKVPWSTYMKVKKCYKCDAGDFVPEVAAHPGDETLYLNIADRVNGGKMRVPWKIWLKVRRWYLVDIWDRVNSTWMTVPRKVYLKVKQMYDKDETYLYDRVNDCPMKVSWHNYCKVRHYYTDIAVDARPGDSTLMIAIPDRVNYTTMRVPWHHYRKMGYMLRMWDDKEPRTWIWDRVNLCPMQIKWHHYLKVAHYFGYMVAARPGDTELFTWIWDRINSTYMRVPWRFMEKVKHYYDNEETFIWDKVNKCEMKVPWNTFMAVRHHYGFTIDSRPGDDQLHHPIWDRVNNCWMRVPRPIYLKVKKYYGNSFTFIFDRVNQCPMRVSWPNFMKVHHYYLDFYPPLACRPDDETLYVFIQDKVNLCKMRVSWANYLKVKKYVEIPKYFAFGAKK